MAEANLPSPDLLRQLFKYDPETGALTWRERPREMFQESFHWKRWNTRYAGRAASSAIRGYLRVTVGGKSRRAHRVIWALVHGAWPEGEIDHINGVRSDNRLVNLREVSRVINARNVSLNARNASGVTGVYRQGERWRAFIGIGGSNVSLGSFVTFAEAVAARKAAAKVLRYHENHGRIPGIIGGLRELSPQEADTRRIRVEEPDHPRH